MCCGLSHGHFLRASARACTFAIRCVRSLVTLSAAAISRACCLARTWTVLETYFLTSVCICVAFLETPTYVFLIVCVCRTEDSNSTKLSHPEVRPPEVSTHKSTCLCALTRQHERGRGVVVAALRTPITITLQTLYATHVNFKPEMINKQV